MGPSCLTQFNPKDPRSLNLRQHCQTSAGRVTAAGRVQQCDCAPPSRRWRDAHTQSLHTNALDEALACRPIFRRALAATRRLICSRKGGTNAIIDPWGGSYYVERRERDLAQRPGAIFQEVEAPAAWKAIEAGVPKCGSRESLRQDLGADRMPDGTAVIGSTS